VSHQHPASLFFQVLVFVREDLLTVQPRLASDLPSSFLNLPCVGIIAVFHHSQLGTPFKKKKKGR
jgi:hypothetical protein